MTSMNEAAWESGLKAFDGWQQIESAPSDGSPFLAIRCEWWSPVNGNDRWIFSRVFESYYDPSTQRFEAYGLKQPTHWMPLPPPPTLLARARRKRDDHNI